LKELAPPDERIRDRKDDKLKIDTEREGDGGKGLLLCGPLTLATAEVSCWKCKQVTTVAALAAASVVDLDDGEHAQGQDRGSFVHSIDEADMPGELGELLASAAPHYRPLFSKTLGETNWANACEHCGALQGAFFLHNEPDGPFFGPPLEFKGAMQQLLDRDVHVFGAAYSL